MVVVRRLARLRFQRRKRIAGVDMSVSKRGASMSKRTSHGSVGIGRNGPRLSVRNMRGISALFGKH